MDLFQTEQGTYRFDRFHLDPTRRVLCIDGRPVKLAERLFDLLLYLVTSQGRVVERDELIQAVWGGRIVEENNLGQAVFLLRKVLQSQNETAKLIVTVPGRGFRFAAPVVFEPILAVTPPVSAFEPRPGVTPPVTLFEPDAPVSAPVPACRKRPSWARIAAALAAAILAAIVLPRWHHAPSANLADLPPHSVAVLAFDNMTGDPAQSYFSDGLSQELIDRLSRLDAVKVAARTSAFSFKGSHATIAEIAARLGVGTVLEGSVRGRGDRMRIAADLVDARTGLQLWARSYDQDRSRDDPLAVQADIASSVASALAIRLVGADAAKLAAGGTHSAPALDAYLHGAITREFVDEAHSRAALADYSRAVRLDPNYAQAYASRAAALDFLSAVGGPATVEERRSELAAAMADIDRAIALAPMLAQAHLVKSDIRQDELNFRGEAAELQQAVDLAPGDARVLGRFGTVEGMLGHFDRAVPAVRRSILLDPLAYRPYRNLARLMLYQKKFDESLALYRQAYSLDTHVSFSKLSETAFVLLSKGDWNGARSICEKGQGWASRRCLAIAYHGLGRPADAQAELESLQKENGDTVAYQYAQIYAQWGQPDVALHWLWEAVRLRDSGLCELMVDGLLDPVRGLPEFGRIASQLDFP